MLATEAMQIAAERGASRAWQAIARAVRLAVAVSAGLLAVPLAACGPPPLRCDFTEAGVCYAVEAGDLTLAQAHHARTQAEEVWGEGVLSGWTVRLASETGCTASSDACALLEDRVIVIRWICRCSMALLIHEAGHAAIGDRRHADARWREATAAEVEAERECRNEED